MSNKIVVRPDGRIEFIYTDELRELLKEGQAYVGRVSHVEPDPFSNKWTADMNPVGGPILGMFETRAEALAAEVAWLDQNFL